MLEIYQNNLNVEQITNKWYSTYQDKNFGALITFIGIIRDEDNIQALSFDIYKPILKKWFDKWQEKAKKQNAIILMAHSLGDVKIHQSSFIAGILSPQRKVALSLINDFVEDFKKNAPIWKYDVISNKRIYAKDRSNKIDGAGLLK
jgi:molybdopterin synthase catalytic subunit